MRRLLSVAAAGATALTGLAVGSGVTGPPQAAAAQAGAPGTLVYVKGYDVYLARPDGTGERRLTTNGTASDPWVSPTGDNLGTIVAARDSMVYRMDRSGTILDSFDPPAIDDGPEVHYDGTVVKAAVSPDGGRVAYTYRDYHCELAVCADYFATGIASADGTSPSIEYGFLRGDNPSWVSDSRLIGNGPDRYGLRLLDIGDDSWDWFHDGEFPKYVRLAEPAVSRDGRLLATTRGTGADSRVTVYEVNGDIVTGSYLPPAATICQLPAAQGQGSPAFAPDSSALAWSQPEGVWVKPDPLDCDADATLVLPGARDVSWAEPELPAGPGNQPDQQQDPGSKTPVTGLALQAAPRLVGKARPGKVLKVKGGAWTPTPSALTYQWLRNGKAIKKATKASYRITRKDRGKRISVRVTADTAGLAGSVWTSKKVKVRR
ncbi:hypothetical protein QI633_21135 [Nocardioides sp. QY071]|uniref:hypothetical protein n=1 Tax=Nocardioides sp. QY071 TaxID=3044187 RepID=UPI00249CB450|nr:hypothetical protein [Nocardioides sp. QY071]WGY01032.1 hypothetical protein QI633_21135 [Nocardioides sp. QY071]